MALTRPSGTVVVHYYLRWARYSATHSIRGATARAGMRGSTGERALVDQGSHGSQAGSTEIGS